jgi:hypothetical protein
VGRSSEPTDGRWQRGAIIRGLDLADSTATPGSTLHAWAHPNDGEPLVTVFARAGWRAQR